MYVYIDLNSNVHNMKNILENILNRACKYFTEVIELVFSFTNVKKRCCQLYVFFIILYFAPLSIKNDVIR